MLIFFLLTRHWPQVQRLQWTIVFFFLSWPQGMWNLSSLTRDPTRVPCSGSIESSALNSQGSPIWTIVFNQTLLVCIIILILYYSLGQFLFWYNFQLREKLQKQCKELLSTYDPVSRTGYILLPWLCHFFFFLRILFWYSRDIISFYTKSLSVCFLRARTLSNTDTTQLSKAGSVLLMRCYYGTCSSQLISAAVPGASLYGSCTATQRRVQYGVTQQP